MNEWIDIQSPHPGNSRYEKLEYSRCGRSGLKMPRISLGFWHNFGEIADQNRCKKIVYSAFDAGITYFDLANNYGPPPGSAEETFGRILKGIPRDETVVATKAGYYMWPGPYGIGGSRKYLLTSLDKSLLRLQTDYVDIFYSHRPDPETPIEETLEALDAAVRSGKALYVGLSNYSADQTKVAVDTARKLGLTIPIVNQSRLNFLERRIDDNLMEFAENQGLGLVAYSPLKQGILSNRYIDHIPNDSRAARKTWDTGDLKNRDITEAARQLSIQLGEVAKERSQSLAQMAISWVLRNRIGMKPITSVVIGVSNEKQLAENLDALDDLEFENIHIDKIEELVRTYLVAAQAER